MARLPAYAKALLAERHAGRHPPHVRVMFGPGIPRRASDSMVAVIAHEYEPGRLDLTCLAGVLVSIVDWTNGDDDETTIKLLALLVEVDKFGAYPELRTHRSIAAPRGSRWALESRAPFPLDTVSVSDLNYFLAPPLYRVVPRV